MGRGGRRRDKKKKWKKKYIYTPDEKVKGESEEKVEDGRRLENGVADL